MTSVRGGCSVIAAVTVSAATTTRSATAPEASPVRSSSAWLRAVVKPGCDRRAPSVCVARSADGCTGLAPVRPVVADQAGETWLRGVWPQRQAEPRRVEVGVDVGERRQQHAAAPVDDRQVRVVGWCNAVGPECRDAPVAHQHVDDVPSG